MKMRMKCWWAALMVSLLLAALAAIPFTGCKTITGDDGAEVKVVDTNAVLQIAVAFRNAARNSALLAIGEDPALTQWFVMAQVTIGQFVEGSNHDPEAFKEALSKLPKLNDKWAKMVVGIVIDAYEIYFINYAKPLSQKTDVAWVACTFLIAVQDGFIDATSGRAMMVGGKVWTLEAAKAELQSRIALGKK